jgi:two-component system copper resistance phosphate regulon response regulator CusR
MKILIVDDEKEIILFLKSNLNASGFVVDKASSGKKGLSLAENNSYDIIILDLNLPDLDGFEICKILRTKKIMTPILVLSGNNNTENKIKLLNSGVDDYMTKPFALEELIARVNALLRRPKEISDNLLCIKDLELDQQNQIVKRNGEEVYLTRKEFLLLEYLMIHSCIVISRGELMEHVWDMEANLFSKTIETHVLNLRRKIDSKRSTPLLKSVSGRGYRFN